MHKAVIGAVFFSALFAQGPHRVTFSPNAADDVGAARWLEKRANGAHYIDLKAPDALAGNITWRWPSADSAGCLQSNGSGVLSLGSCTGTADIWLRSTNDTIETHFSTIFSNDSEHGAHFQFVRARGTEASPLNLAANDALGKVQWSGRIGAANIPAAAIYSYTNSVGATEISGDLRFDTCLNGSGCGVRLMVHPDGTVTIGTAADSAFAFDVAGTARIQGNLTLTNDILPEADGVTDIGTASFRIGNSYHSLFRIHDGTRDRVFMGHTTGGAITVTNSSGTVAATISYAGNIGALTAVSAPQLIGWLRPESDTVATHESSIYSAADALDGARFMLKRGRGTATVPADVAAGDMTGAYVWQAYRGASFREMAEIRSYVDTLVSATAVSGSLRFFTVGSGGGALTERWRIDDDGDWLGIDGSNIGQQTANKPDTVFLRRLEAHDGTHARIVLNNPGGGSNTGSAITLADASGNNIFFVSYGGTTQMVNGSATGDMTIGDDGSVAGEWCVGCSSTTYKLEISGGASKFGGSIEFATDNAYAVGASSVRPSTIFARVLNVQSDAVPQTDNSPSFGSHGGRFSNFIGGTRVAVSDGTNYRSELLNGGINVRNSSGTLMFSVTGTSGNVDTAGVYQVGGTSGQSVTITVRAAGGASDCTIIFTGGIKTGGTC